MENEIWKPIVGYEGLYQVSNLGRIKSLSFVSSTKSWVLTNSKNSRGYFNVTLTKSKKGKSMLVHQLVAGAFLNHKPCGHKLVVNHINFDKTDNRVDNIEIVTQRENANLKHIKSKSKYVGVTLDNKTNRWRARIVINKKRFHLGCFATEIEAHNAYQNKLKSIL